MRVKREAANVEDVRRVSNVATADDDREMSNARRRRGEGERPRLRLLQLHFHIHPTAGGTFKKCHGRREGHVPEIIGFRRTFFWGVWQDLFFSSPEHIQLDTVLICQVELYSAENL